MVPDWLAARVNRWPGDFTSQTQRVEAVLAAGLKLTPPDQFDATFGHSGAKEYVWANLPPDLAAKFFEPVDLEQTSITDRLITLLHCATQSHEEAPTLQAPLQLRLTGT